MALISFVQKFAFKKKGSSENSIQQEIMLQEMREAKEDIAVQVSQETKSLNGDFGSKSSVYSITSEEVEALDREFEENSLEKLFKAIELATSPEEILALMQKYEEVLANFSQQILILRSEKHLKEYLSMVAALSILQKMIKNSEFLNGKLAAEILQKGLKSQQKYIEDLVKGVQLKIQDLITSGKLGEAGFLQVMRQLQQAFQQIKVAGQARENVVRLQTSQIDQGKKNAGQMMQMQINGKISVQNSILGSKGQIQSQKEYTNPAILSSLHSQRSQQDVVPSVVNTVQSNNIVQIAHSVKPNMRQEQGTDRQNSYIQANAPRDNQVHEGRKSSFVESYKKESSITSDISESAKRECKCANHVERAEQIKTSMANLGF